EVDLNDGGSQSLIADKIFINTGGRPSRPDVEGLDKIAFLDSTSIMELDQLPEHLLVMGGGYIGLEFGQMFRRFGSEVTIVQRGARLFTNEDPDVADEVANILREDGITLLLDSEVVRVESKQAEIGLNVRTPQGQQALSGSHLLVGVGRTPN